MNKIVGCINVNILVMISVLQDVTTRDNWIKGDFLVVQGLGLRTPKRTVQAPGFDPWRGTGSHMLHLRVHMPQLKTTQPNI